VERQHLAKEDRDNVVAMTTPVFMSGSDSNRTLALVMPARLKSGQVPKPQDSSVAVRDLAAGATRSRRRKPWAG
jgi:hypothetical protein